MRNRSLLIKLGSIPAFGLLLVGFWLLHTVGVEAQASRSGTGCGICRNSVWTPSVTSSK